MLQLVQMEAPIGFVDHHVCASWFRNSRTATLASCVVDCDDQLRRHTEAGQPVMVYFPNRNVFIECEPLGNLAFHNSNVKLPSPYRGSQRKHADFHGPDHNTDDSWANFPDSLSPESYLKTLYFPAFNGRR